MVKCNGLIAGLSGIASGSFAVLSVEYSWFFMIGAIMFAVIMGTFAAIADTS